VPPLINIGEEKTKKKETWQNAGSFAGYQKVSPGTTLMQYCKFNNANPHYPPSSSTTTTAHNSNPCCAAFEIGSCLSRRLHTASPMPQHPPGPAKYP
jgi:hypothetical protein